MAIGVDTGACNGAGAQSTMEMHVIAYSAREDRRDHHRGHHRRCSGNPGWYGQVMVKTITRKRKPVAMVAAETMEMKKICMANVTVLSTVKFTL